MKIKANVIGLDGEKYASDFNSLEEAKAWVEENHKDAEVKYEEVFSDKIRIERDKILKGTDWLFMSDVPLEKKHRTTFRNYRQYLRDLKQKKAGKLLQFEQWLRVKHPEEFLDGGEGVVMVKKFNYYL